MEFENLLTKHVQEGAYEALLVCCTNVKKNGVIPGYDRLLKVRFSLG